MRRLPVSSTLVRDNVERAVAAMKAGRVVVVVDTDRNSGDLVFAAEYATTELLAFTIRHTSGFVCVALTEQDCSRLELPPVSHSVGDTLGSAYRVSVDLRGNGTGISAVDRAGTIAGLSSAHAEPDDFSRPGHVIPIAVGAHGVLGRPGRAEAAVDLARLAGLRPAGGLCEIVSTDRPCEMAQGEELERFAAEHDLQLVGIEDLVAYRRLTEPQVHRHADAGLPTAYGLFRAVGYRGDHDAAEYVALVRGDVDGADVPIHVHTECLTGDVFGSGACDCGTRLAAALDTVAGMKCGVVVYVRPDGPPNACGLSGHSRVGDTERINAAVACILSDLGVASAQLTALDLASGSPAPILAERASA
ncbi:3,4-dihydroxy-2-butanone-4-phosphate synthase [Nocardia alni]|uniref:3,4-dihydroxy-2-butanone-4-phosphate synthase n=1 Tax=Nocardia alni TaxID=2815723 RepID=UPI001C2512D6|nr:3,4-dihydroxy-2-butanone-4-phosphate synthase [Nocardia alni]